MKAQRFIQKNSIFAAIALTIFLIGASSALTFYGQYQLTRFTSIKEQVEAVNLKVDNILLYMNDMDKGVRGFLIVPDDQFLLPYNFATRKYAANFDTLQLMLEQQGFLRTNELIKAKGVLQGYQELVGTMITLKRQGDEEGVLSIYNEDPGYPVWKKLDEFVRGVQAFEQTQYQEAKARYQYYLDTASFMQIVLLIIGIPTLIFVIHQIGKSEKERKQLFVDLLESRKAYLFDDASEHDLQHPKSLINHLILDLEKAAGFVKKISEGDYSVRWEGISDDNREANQENLAGALIQMREQMKERKQEDQQRLWTTEGLSKVAEITRTHQDELQQLADSLLSYLVTYTKANQGSLFFLQEDQMGQACLTLTACYAYDKKKHAEKSIKLGQGLVGQTYLERKTLQLTRIPDQYVSITSGLGEATPSTLLLVPLIFNEQVMGVLEVAAFEMFAPHQVAFLESVGEVIASAVATVRMNSQTRQLLAQSQEGTEALRAQEEEMRQNMEELQATQEEMQRKTQEYEAVIEQQKEKIQLLEQIN